MPGSRGSAQTRSLPAARTWGSRGGSVTRATGLVPRLLPALVVSLLLGPDDGTPCHGLCPCAGSSIVPRATCSLSPGESGPQQPTLPAQRGAATMPAPHSTQPRGQPSGCQIWEVKDPRNSPWGCMVAGGGALGETEGVWTHVPICVTHSLRAGPSSRSPRHEARDPGQGWTPIPCDATGDPRWGWTWTPVPV